MSLEECPDRQTLEQLLLGKLPPIDLDRLGGHLERCTVCAKTAETLIPADGLTQALRIVTVLRGDERLLEQALERGKQLGCQLPTVQPDATVIGQTAANVEIGHRAEGFKPQQNPGELSFLAPAQQPDELGRLGNYRILQILGVGGMGIVFRAEDPALRRQVALKVMKPSVALNRSAKDRFLREAQFTAAIEHDNIVAIYQVGEDQGVPFIAMPLLKGESLKARLDRDGKLPQTDVLRIGREIASGLAAAHERDLIHRDIKPDNIWIEEKTNRARILDFGLVRAASEDAGLTQSGTVMGTPRYMPPEQAMGQDVDFRCDLFSLGAVLYHLVSGKLPFEGSNVTATLMAVVQKDPLPLDRVVSELHPTLCKLIHKLMAKDREKRPKSAKEVAKLLAAIYQDLRQSTGKRPEPSSTANVTNLEAERRAPSGVSPSEPPKAVTAGLTPARSDMLPNDNDAQQRSSSPTDPLAALPIILTEPSVTTSGRKAAKRTPAIAARRPPGKPPVKKLLTVLGAGGILLTLLGIIVIKITNKDGKETTIRVSEGTETDIAAEPGSKVSIRQESESAASTPPMKADVAAESGGKVQIPPESKITESTTPPTDEAALAEYFALNRRAAEKALAVGGPHSFVGLEDPANHLWHFAAPGESLPEGPFLVRKWSIMNSTTATNADLEVLRGLRHVRDINLATAFHCLDAGAMQHVAAIRAPLECFAFHTPIKTSDLSVLPDFQQLYNIGVLGPEVDDQWAFLKKFPHLRTLTVNTGPWPDLTPLGDFRHLRVLSLTGEAPDLTAVAQLQQKNAQLRVMVSSDGKPFRLVGQDPLRAIIPELLQAGLPLAAHLFDGTSKPIQPFDVDALFASGVNFVSCHAIPAETRLTNEQRNQITLLALENLQAPGQQEADLLAAALSDRHDMRSLQLPGSDLTDAGLKHLEALVGLSGLDVTGTKVTPTGLNAFRAAVPGCVITTSDGVIEPDYLREPGGANHSQSLNQKNWPADAPQPAIAPFDAAQAKVHQEAWAKYLGVPVEYTNSIGMKFVLIPPGEFTMGMSNSDAEAQAAMRSADGHWTTMWRSSAPEHRVRLTQPFFVGVHEVTQEQYELIVGTNPSYFSKNGEGKDKVAGRDTKQYPVEMVSFVDATGFCARLSQRENLKPADSGNAGDSYRLPTEAEWEFVCRGGTTTTWFHGNDESTLDTVAWIERNSDGTTHPVGLLKANPFGLHDVHGNVWEWCQDRFDAQDYIRRATTLSIDPLGSEADTPRVLRGGYWCYVSYDARSALRFATGDSDRMQLRGFRTVISVDAVRLLVGNVARADSSLDVLSLVDIEPDNLSPTAEDAEDRLSPTDVP